MLRMIFAFTLFTLPLWATSTPVTVLTASQTDGVSSICSMLGTTVADAPSQWVQTGLERWEYVDSYADQMDALMPYFEQAGFVDEVTPLQTQYDYVIILGGVLSRLQQRFDYVCDLWEQGITFNNIVFLTGDRALRDDGPLANPCR